MKIIEKKVEELIPYVNNPRNNEAAVDFVAASIKEFGFKNPIIIDKDGVIVAGHTRHAAAKKLGLESVPCIMADDLTEQQIKAFRLADNKTAELATWDLEKLEIELESIGDLEMTEFGFESFENSENGSESTPEMAEDELPDIPEEPKSKLGDVYILGEHRLICGDSTDSKVIERLMGGQKADMVFTDPPYGMKKEKEGVLNDNLNYDNLLEFNKKWIPISFENLKDNGSWYCWGIDEPLMDIYSNILKPLQKENKITFRNLITWKKENDNPTMLFNGACSSTNRSFYTNEKCLFVMCGVQGFNNNQDNYFEGWEPVRQYLVGEAEKVGLTPKKLQEITGVGMYSHWFGKSQFAFITEEHYKELQNYYKKEYDVFKKEYDELKKEYYSTRAYFDGTQDQCIDVWVHDVTSQKEREFTGGHATPKPIALCGRAIKSSSKEGETVLDLFGGSGSTLIACEQLNRKCYMCELDPKYVDVIIARWENFTGNKAEKIES